MSYLIPLKKVFIDKKMLYPDTEIIIKEKGVTVIAGDNGCGKTTLLNQIMYLYPEAAIMIPQDNDLIFENYSVEDNICFFNGINDDIRELLNKLNMEYLLSRKPSQLSGGEKRIISLLRLFVVDKDFVILDEPTNDLDYSCVDRIIQIILDLSKKKSVLIVTHDERIARLAHNKYIITERKILQEIIVDEPFHPLPIKTTSIKFKKAIRKDVIGILLFLAIIVSVVCFEVSYFVFKPVQIDYFDQNQTNLAVKQYGNIRNMLNNGYIPITLYLSYKGSVDLDFLYLYADEINNLNYSGLSSNMSVDKNYGNNIFLGVFWNPETNEKIYPLKDYQTLYEIVYGEKINLSDYITEFDGITEIAEVFDGGYSRAIDIDLYSKMEEAYYLSYPNLQPLLFIIIDENTDVLKNANENWLIKNNTTIEISNQINSLVSIKNSIVILLLCLLSSIGIYVLYFIIEMKLLRKHIVIYRNFGIPSNHVAQIVIQNKCATREKTLIFLPFFIINLVFLFIEQEKILFGLAAMLMLVTFFSVILTSRKILFRNIRSIYSYGGIYEN